MTNPSQQSSEVEELRKIHSAVWNWCQQAESRQLVGRDGWQDYEEYSFEEFEAAIHQHLATEVENARADERWQFSNAVLRRFDKSVESGMRLLRLHAGHQERNKLKKGS